ncbi:hypothetical protein BC936DRAFT_147603 [Jimgerdemannia flammicorona]|uniref:Uncharacterized protein n=1 Tax=Jimgerdemannia flammicorona TaxID=994334 RepID=A0A433D4Y5_9FUNG|nr:hypothetical protein BC936DRAFT_147603 [Jimgerdemannia flammicorona]
MLGEEDRFLLRHNDGRVAFVVGVDVDWNGSDFEFKMNGSGGRREASGISVAGVKYRTPKSATFDSRTKAVSERFIFREFTFAYGDIGLRSTSLAIASILASSRSSVSNNTAQGLPPRGVSVNASTW